MPIDIGGLANTTISAAYFAICGAILLPLLRNGQVRSNRLGTSTAAIFFSCAVGHGFHAYHDLTAGARAAAMPGMAVMSMTSWYEVGWDVVTACVALNYWTLRRTYGALMKGATLFQDLQQQQRVVELEHREALTAARSAADRDQEQARARALQEITLARDAAVAATKAKSAFLATMSHEIRTPMNAVIGMTGLLMHTRLDAQQRELAETVRASGDALLTIINDVLDFSKIESGDLELEEQPFELQEAVESALALVAYAAEDKGLELVAELADGCPEMVLGDITRFRQVLVNVLSNAVKFTAEGEVVVTLRALPPADDDPTGPVHLQATVRDTGIGIPADRLDRLFRSFSQVDSSTTRTYGGTGLGLVISRRLAHAMGGDLQVASTLGVGSTFTFTCALARTAQRRRAEPVQVAATLAGARVLVVDDHAENRRVLQLQTRRWGMTCTDVETPAAALELLAGDDRFDIAILDMHMPEMDGAQLAAAIRALPTAAGLPLVLLTSLQWSLAPEQRALFAATLTKPTKSGVLRARLLEALAPAEAVVRGVETAGGSRRLDGPPVGRQLRVLLAEDNTVNQKVAQLMLEQLGHFVDTVSDGLEAVAAVHLADYDVVLMDMQMPHMDGVRATERIRSDLPAGRQPLIMAMTANVLAEDRLACMQAGMDGFVSKPIRTAELAAALLGLRPATRPVAVAAPAAD